MKVPLHLAIIPDGNRRYGRKYGLPLIKAYARGIEKLREVVEWSKEIGIKILTVWGFSTENLQRSSAEKRAFFTLLKRKAQEFLKNKGFEKMGVRVKFIGRLDFLPKGLVHVLKKVEEQTSSANSMLLNIALAYGGRQEIVDACNRIIRAGIKNVDQETFAKFLYTADLPDPDLVIRTSGEMRLSGFLPWQIAYSELVFLPCLWPELTKRDFLWAISEYSRRERRFGR